MQFQKWHFLLAVCATLVVSSIAQAKPLQVNSITPIAAQRIDSDEGNFPAGLLENGDRFGRSVISIGDLDQDGVLDLAVGVRSDDDGGTDTGAVYILFMNADLTVKSTSKISATSGGLAAGLLDAGDFFGYSLASPGDLNNDGIQDLIIGASNDDDGETDAGAFYNIFLDRTGAVQGAQKVSNTAGTITPANLGTPLSSGDLFGQAASSIGDFNNDGLIDVAIGAPGDDDAAGALWFLSLRDNGTVAGRTKISSPDLPAGTLDSGDGFGGRHVANIGDLDGDGIDEIAVGAFRDDDGGTDQGALYVLFLNEDLSVRDSQKISSLAGGFTGTISDGDLFGMTVAPLGDVDGDGIPDIAVGSNRDDDGGENRGALFFLLLNADGTVKEEAKVSSTENFGFDSLDLLDNERFGRALGFVGDLSGDGTNVLAVGAGAGVDGGAIWLLQFETSSVLLGDCNLDGEVRFNDVPAFVTVLLSRSFLSQADCNQDGEVRFDDVPAFVDILLGR